MNRSLTVEVPGELADWVEKTAKDSGMSVADYVSTVLDVARARSRAGNPFEKYAGKITGLPPDLSSRKGFDRGEK